MALIRPSFYAILLIVATIFGWSVAAVSPATITVRNVPAIPASLVAKTRPYLESCSSRFVAWHPVNHSMLLASQSESVAQLFTLDAPIGLQKQISFANDSISGGIYSPDGSQLLVEMDSKGDEAFQIYALNEGQLSLVSDGFSRNLLGSWHPEGKQFVFASNRESGVYNNLYLSSVDDLASRRMIDASKDGGWSSIAFTPDGQSLLVFNYISQSPSQLQLINLASGSVQPVTHDTRPATYADIEFAPDGTLWAVTDRQSDVTKLGRIDLATGMFESVISSEPFEISRFTISRDGAYIAYVTNMSGVDTLQIFEIATGQQRRVTGLSQGSIRDLEFSNDGKLGFTFSSNQTAGDAYSLDPVTLNVTRWTFCKVETRDFSQNVLPELVEIKSFDGEPMSGLLYRADPIKFPGKRPVIVDFHGGPEGQAIARFIGSDNYLVDEMGVSLFYPNVRGSTGFGKRFQTLDDGPFRREHAVRDVGEFLRVLRRDKNIDADRIAVTGGSYGGYLCYASAIAYRKRIKAAMCTAAISNFVTFLEGTEDYRRSLRREEYGDERDPVQRAKLEAISPMAKVRRIQAPLFIAAGVNDPRVPIREAQQIISAVEQNGGTVWSLIASDEGHSFRRKENSDYVFLASLMFWQQFLLGEESP